MFSSKSPKYENLDLGKELLDISDNYKEARQKIDAPTVT